MSQHEYDIPDDRTHPPPAGTIDNKNLPHENTTQLKAAVGPFSGKDNQDTMDFLAMVGFVAQLHHWAAEGELAALRQC